MNFRKILDINIRLYIVVQNFILYLMAICPRYRTIWNNQLTTRKSKLCHVVLNYDRGLILNFFCECFLEFLPCGTYSSLSYCSWLWSWHLSCCCCLEYVFLRCRCKNSLLIWLALWGHLNNGWRFVGMKFRRKLR